MTDDERPGRGRGSWSATDTPGDRRSDDATLAPVIPLFGRSRRSGSAVTDTSASEDSEAATTGRRTTGPTGVIGTPEGGAIGGAGTSARAGWARTAASTRRDTTGHPAGAARFGSFRDVAAIEDDDDDIAGDVAERIDAQAAADDVRERAEERLLRKLRSRSLSISEARSVLRDVEGADDAVISDIVDHFVDLGYLDDAVFAEQLVLSAIEKRGEGRRAVALTLMKRGIPRDIADAALAEMPDDDSERALEFARSKARSVGGKDDDAALRRLAGQLARRGYPSSIALSAARQALREVRFGSSRPPRSLSSGVRFTPDE